jgi:branched-chain amino acid transport system substrate-binding protein
LLTFFNKPNEEVGMMNKKHVLWVAVFLITLLMATGMVYAQNEIRVGALNDMTGGTADVGKDYAMGIAEAIAYVNDTGGINGKKIKLFQYDYGYRIPEAITTYKRFRDFDKVVAVLGWGTGDTEALSPTVTKDKMPYVSASYSAHLTDPKKTPYNLFFASDYSTNARSAITAWYDHVWKKDARFKDRVAKGEKPRFVTFYAAASPYGSAPIKAIKDQAVLLGFEVGPDQDVALTALDTKSQVLGAKQFKPDLVWHGNTTMSVATALRDAYALGLGADHISNTWGFDENLPRLAGPASENVMGAQVSAFFGGKAPMMDKIKAYAKKLNPGVPENKRTVHTIKAWGDVLLLTDAMKVADKQGKLTGETIMKAMETFKNKDLGVGSLPVTFSAIDHRAASGAPVYKIVNGKFVLVDMPDLKKRWPEKWEKEWLGW